MKKLLTFALMAAALAACGGRVSPGEDSGDGTGSGGGSSGGSNGGGGSGSGGSPPPGAATDACSAAEDCAYWYCRCTDGAVVNSRTCRNGYCLDAASQCGAACTDFGHGGWTGEVGNSGGGSGGSNGGAGYCSYADQCPAYYCTCPDGTSWNSRNCTNNVCQGQGVTCESACRDHQRSAPPPPATVHGCALSDFDGQSGVTIEFYGTGWIESEARNAALAQCQAAGYYEWFCSGATMRCSTETMVPYGCEWSNYSTSHSRTVRYYADGGSETAAKAHAVDNCVNADTDWYAWFCGSGTLSCSRR